MTLPRLEGFDESVGPALASLTDTIGQLIKPTAKYDHALKALFMEKPELMQKFVDIEKQNPGTLRAFGFGEGATDFLSGMKESIPSIRMGLGRDQLEAPTTSGERSRKIAGEQEATGLTPAQAQGEALQQWMLESGLDLLHRDPQAFDRAVRNQLKLPSQFEQQVEQDTQGVYAQGKKLADMSIPEIVQGLQNGTIKNEDINAGLLHPAATAGVKAALQEYSFNREAALRRDLGRMATERTRAGSTALEVAQRRAAYDQYAASGGVAPIGAFYEVMWGEPYQGTPAPKEQIAAVNKWLTTTQADKEVKRKGDLLRAIKPLYDQSLRKKNQRPPTKELVQGNINKINDLLEAAGSRWRAEYDEIGHWFSADEPQIVFRDRQSNVISRDATPILSNIPVPGDTVTPQENPPGLSAYERQVLGQLIGMQPSEQDSVIHEMYQQAGADENGNGGDPNKLEVIQRILDNLPAQ